MSAQAVERVDAVPRAAARPASPSPFGVVLATQWKWSRLWVLAGAVAGFAIPVASVAHAGDPRLGFPDPRVLLESMALYGGMYALLAMLNGLVLGSLSWLPDDAGRYVYALSLPVPRWYYVLLRFGAGALLALVPALSLWLGARVAAAVVVLPPGLYAYPDAVGLRFVLAALVAYALCFGIYSSGVRTALRVLLALGALLVLDATFALGGGMEESVTGRILDALVRWPGVLEIFTGRWMLIDV